MSTREFLRQVEIFLYDYRDYTRYLQHRDREVLGKRLDLTLNSLSSIHDFGMTLNRQEQAQLETYDKKAKALDLFLAQFISEYTRREVERHSDFFRKAV